MSENSEECNIFKLFVTTKDKKQQILMCDRLKPMKWFDQLMDNQIICKYFLSIK